MYGDGALRRLAVESAKRFSNKVGQVAEAAGVETFEFLQSPKPEPMNPPKPSPGEIYRANALAKDRTRAVIAEAETKTNPAAQSEAIKQLSQERVIGTPDFKDINYMEFAIAVSRAICRVRLPNGFGTGSLIGPNLIMTNHHVIESISVAQQSTAEFDYQDDINGNRLQLQTFICDPQSFFYTNADLDFTIVAVQGASQIGKKISEYPWLKLLPTPGKTSDGMPINIIQHPNGGLKQIVFRNNTIISIPEGKPDFLYYTTDTEPGSSGSPCFTDSWDMVALHHMGVPKLGPNNQVEGWVANEGVRISAIVAALRSDVADPRLKDSVSQFLDSTPPNPVEVARRAASGDGGSVVPPATVAPSSGSAIWTIPLTIQVSLGDPVFGDREPKIKLIPPGETPPKNGGDSPPNTNEALIVDPYSVPREGFDPNFLAWTQPIPLPTLSADQVEDTVVVPDKYQGVKWNNPHILDYHYYSIAMCKSRRFAWYSAANVDGDNRPKLPKRSSDKWHIDPRIEEDVKNPKFQLGEELYAADNTDRGHLTRYLDLAWGNEQQALSAMADTFHFTNCTLQLSSFNEDKDRWQGLEQFLLENHARKEKRRIIVITGPVLKRDELTYKNPKMAKAVLVPTTFWKVCAIVRQDGSLSVTAFVMDQKDLIDLPGAEEAAFDVKPTQVTIAELEDRTGLKFEVLRDHDHFAQSGVSGTLEKTLRKTINDYSDIVVG